MIKVKVKNMNHLKGENPKLFTVIDDYIEFLKQKTKDVDKNGNYIFKKEEVNEFHRIFYDLIDIILATYHASIKDSKTNLYDMTFFNEVLKLEFEDSKRDNSKLSVIIVDLDGFKKINDTYGHIVGDNIIIEIAKILKNSARKNDVVARLGGDEFIVMLKGDELAAKQVMKRIRLKMKTDKILKKYDVHFSAGIATITDSDKGYVSLEKRADKMLYEAKKNGKNKDVFD